jgi:lipopolysaccharide biosynthesis regulator YciM
MYTKILLVVIIIILSVFFYLHVLNPATVTFVVTAEHTYTVPVTLLLFAAFFAGAFLAVLNSLLVDAKRAILEFKSRREKRAQVEAEANYKKGVEALLKGHVAEGRALIEKAVGVRPADTGMLVSLAESYMREDKPRDALRTLEQGLAENPDSIGILLAIARYATEAGDYFRAEKALQEVLRLEPKNLFGLKGLRDIKTRDGLWVDATAIQKTIVDCEHDKEAQKREKRLLTGILYESASYYAEAGKPAPAFAMLKEALKNDEAFMPAHILLGTVLLKQGNAENAIKVWEKASARYKGAEPIMLKLEDIYIRESAPEKILEKYRKEIISNPNNINLRLLLARLYLRLEMVDNAIEELERLYQEGEEGSYLLVLLGEAYLRRKQSGKAAHLFQKALGIDKEFLPPFSCSLCGHTQRAWLPKCPVCREWNTQVMSRANVSPPLDSAPRPLPMP